MWVYPEGGVGLSRGRCRFVWRAVQICLEGGADFHFVIWQNKKTS